MRLYFVSDARVQVILVPVSINIIVILMPTSKLEVSSIIAFRKRFSARWLLGSGGGDHPIPAVVRRYCCY